MKNKKQGVICSIKVKQITTGWITIFGETKEEAEKKALKEASTNQAHYSSKLECLEFENSIDETHELITADK